jgi:hypothetical protein
MKQTGIASIEAGRVERPRKLRELSRAVQRSEEWLLGEDQRENRDHEIRRTTIDEQDGLVRPDMPPGAIVELDVRAGLGGGGIAEHAYVRRSGELTQVDGIKPEPWHVPFDFVRESFRVPVSRLVVLETIGDSMSPTIETNERVFVDVGHRIPSPDGIYAIRDRFGEIIVKRLQVDGDRLLILSDNPRHLPRNVGLDEVEIVGKVVAGIKRF